MALQAVMCNSMVSTWQTVCSNESFKNHHSMMMKPGSVRTDDIELTDSIPITVWHRRVIQF
jgi:hypothetical protein